MSNTGITAKGSLIMLRNACTFCTNDAEIMVKNGDQKTFIVCQADAVILTEQLTEALKSIETDTQKIALLATT